jgi:hypothetical protein
MYYNISENQAGCKAGYSTIDNAFILKSIIDRILRSKRRKLYVAFVDFKKCFDTIDRQLLWNILKENGLKGNLFKAFKSMYVKSCVRCNYTRSEYIQSTVGTKQGCLASPILFCFFIDELERCLSENDINGIQLHPTLFKYFY